MNLHKNKPVIIAVVFATLGFIEIISFFIFENGGREIPKGAELRNILLLMSLVLITAILSGYYLLRIPLRLGKYFMRFSLLHCLLTVFGPLLIFMIFHGITENNEYSSFDKFIESIFVMSLMTSILGGIPILLSSLLLSIVLRKVSKIPGKANS